MLLATALQLYHLAGESLWGDEIFTAIFAASPPPETIRFTAGDIHPPFYYLLVGAWSRLAISISPPAAPDMVTDWLWRWPSALASILTVAVTYRLGCVLGNRRTAALTALLLTLAPVMLKYGQEARMHALFMALSSLTTLCLALALKTRSKKKRWRYWLAYSLTTALNLYTMYFAFIVLAAQGLWVLARGLTGRHQKRLSLPDFLHPPDLRAASLAACLALILYAPWWPVLFDLLSFRAQVGAVEGGVGSPWAFLLKAFAAIGPFGYGVWLFLGLYWGGLLVTWSRDKALALFGGVWLLLPLLLPIFLGDSRALQLRYAFILPVYLLFVSFGVAGLIHLIRSVRPVRPAGREWAWGIAATILTLASLPGILMVYDQQKPEWRQAAAFLAAQTDPADVIISGPLWDDGRFLDYYYPKPDLSVSPPLFTARLPGIAASMAANQGRLWLVTRQDLGSLDGFQPHFFAGVVVLEQVEAEYDPVQLIETMATFCRKAARSAEDWAEAMVAGGVLTPDPRTAKASGYRCEGEVYLAAGDYDSALKPFQRAVETFPGWAGGYVLLAKTYGAMDNLPEATMAYAQAIALNPNWQGDRAVEAETLAQAGRWVEALTLYREIVE